jgi:hypothetical protein
MFTSQSDVIVHLGKTLSAADRTRLERALEAARGVARAQGNPRAARLLVVNYDPSAISALGVLRTVQAQGIPARLVGM